LESLPVTFVKAFDYLAINSFVVNIPMKIGKYKMQLKLEQNPQDTKFLQYYLYQDPTVMTDCIPEYTVSLIDLDDFSVIRSYEMLKKKVKEKVYICTRWYWGWLLKSQS
jgi:hypothetical protein